jgi:hypothetical protein
LREARRPVQPACFFSAKKTAILEAKMSALRPLRIVLLAAGLFSLPPLPDALAWSHPHGDADNSGFADVVTAPAGPGPIMVRIFGTFAPGVGPVIGNNGLIYIGSEQGRLFAFRPDGTEAWRRLLLNEQSIKASTVVGADGSVYVVGVDSFHDHSVTPPVVRQRSTLYKFSAGGDLLWHVDFPDFYSAFPSTEGRGYTTAPPNIWSSGGTEVIMVPAIYRTSVSVDLHLEAFSTTGAFLADTIVTQSQQVISTEGNTDFWDVLSCIVTLGYTCWPITFNSPIIGLGAPFAISWNGQPPLPGVAVFTFQGGGRPWVIVSDGMHDLVGYNFSPTAGFIQVFRAHDATRVVGSPATVLPDGHSLVGTDDGRITFSGPNGVKLNDVGTFCRHEAPKRCANYAAPSRTADSKIVAVQYRSTGGVVVVIQGDHIFSHTLVPGQSIASAAVSRNDIFIATANAFLTFDVAHLQQIQQFTWNGGGLWPPAIGPDGRVYAMASNDKVSNTLFIFPPPIACFGCRTDNGNVQGRSGP